MPKTQFFVPWLNKNLRPLQVSTHSLTTLVLRLSPGNEAIAWPHHQSTHKISQSLHVGLSWDHFNSSLQGRTHIWPHKQQFGLVIFQKIFNKPPLKLTKTEHPVSESSLWVKTLTNFVYQTFDHQDNEQIMMCTLILNIHRSWQNIEYLHFQVW